MPEVAEAPARSAALIKAARRITVKVGSSLLVDSDGVRRDWLRALGEDLGKLREEGRQFVVVSSGAVALGRRRLSLKASARLALKQAAAASGQPLLMRAWEEAVGAIWDPDRAAPAHARRHRIAPALAQRPRDDRSAARPTARCRS